MVAVQLAFPQRGEAKMIELFFREPRASSAMTGCWAGRDRSWLRGADR